MHSSSLFLLRDTCLSGFAPKTLSSGDTAVCAINLRKSFPRCSHGFPQSLNWTLPLPFKLTTSFPSNCDKKIRLFACSFLATSFHSYTSFLEQPELHQSSTSRPYLQDLYLCYHSSPVRPHLKRGTQPEYGLPTETLSALRVEVLLHNYFAELTSV